MFLFLSHLYGSEKPFTKNRAVGNLSLRLLQLKQEYQHVAKQYSNLFGSEFMLKFPNYDFIWTSYP